MIAKEQRSKFFAWFNQSFFWLLRRVCFFIFRKKKLWAEVRFESLCFEFVFSRIFSLSFFFADSMVVHWLALSPHNEKILVQIHSAWSLHLLSSCLCGFCPGTAASSHSPKKRFIGQLVVLNCPSSVSQRLSFFLCGPVVEWWPVQEEPHLHPLVGGLALETTWSRKRHDGGLENRWIYVFSSHFNLFSDQNQKLVSFSSSSEPRVSEQRRPGSSSCPDSH